MPTTRREVLVQIAMTPLAAAQQASHPAHRPAAARPAAGPYKRRVFTDHEFETLKILSDLILPPDEKSGGGAAAGTAEFMDVIASDDKPLAAEFTGGLGWLDRQMQAQHGKTFRECGAAEQKALLDKLAWRERATPDLGPGVRFFALLRQWTVDAFYSSREGVKDLGYMGNTAVAEFNGCPEAVVQELLKRSPS
jgi:hypothetical protein